MPLTLLSKKSWNVYNPENIARVRKDHAEAQAREEEQDRKLDEQDAARRLALLRGESPPPALTEVEPEIAGRTSSRKDGDGQSERRKRKRIPGEDDTEQELRFARENLESRHEIRGEKRKRSQAPITDRNGNINLFPEDERAKTRPDKDKEVEAEKARKARELEDQYTMRFSNAAGRDGLKTGPWYASREARERGEEEERTKNAFGRPDPARKDREQARQISNDPLAFMQKAQAQLKRSERDRGEFYRIENAAGGTALLSDRERHRKAQRRERAENDEERKRFTEVSRIAADESRHRERSDKEEKRRRHKHKHRHEHRESRREGQDRHGLVPEPGDNFRLDE